MKQLSLACALALLLILLLDSSSAAIAKGKALVCAPQRGLGKAKCKKMLSACNANSTPMKWIDIAKKSRCKVETGCKCLADCAYQCESTCNMDAQCRWEDGQCTLIASGELGTKVADCTYSWAPTPPPTPINSNEFEPFSPKLAVDTSVLSGSVLTGKQGISLAISGEKDDAILVGASMDDFGTGNVIQYLTNAKKGGQFDTTGFTLLTKAQNGKVRSLGSSIALSADRKVALVGAPKYGNGRFETGAAFVYRLNARTGKWEEAEVLVGERSVGDANQGTAVALSGDGLTALIGAKDDNGRQGAVWAFRFNSTHWNAIGGGKLTSNVKNTMEFGSALAVNHAGTVALIGAPSTGLCFAYSISRARGEFTLTTTLKGAGGLGASVALNAQGTLALVGAPTRGNGQRGAAIVFEYAVGGKTWKESQVLEVADEEGFMSYTMLGNNVALSADGSTILLAAASTELITETRVKKDVLAFAYYRTVGGKFARLGAPLMPSQGIGEPVEALTVALNARGTIALLGSPSDNVYIGAAWVFKRRDE